MERVVSKINYVIAKPNNLYPLTVQTTDYAIAETTSGYYIYPDNKAVRLTGLHKAKNLDNDNLMFGYMREQMELIEELL